MSVTYELYTIKDQSVTKNNIYVVVDQETRRTAVIDPGGGIKEINEMVKNLGLTLDMILITHTHIDHVREISTLVDQYDCKVYISSKEVDYYSYQCKNLQSFEDEEMIYLGKTEIKCILTPGHTRGSSCFLFENGLFSGDTIFMEGCGMCTEKGGSASDMFHSIAKIKKNISDAVSVYSGHTYSIQQGKSVSYLKKNNIYFLIECENQFIDFRMRKNQKSLFNFG